MIKNGAVTTNSGIAANADARGPTLSWLKLGKRLVNSR
jgi:hypothetical protein